MRNLKSFESFQQVNEENILKKMGASFGSFNKEAIDYAEKALSNAGEKLKTKNQKLVDFKKKEFGEYKSLYEKGDKVGIEIFKKIVKHINLNNNLLYSIIDDEFRPGARYGAAGGTGGGGGS
jgi:hypothetical protein